MKGDIQWKTEKRKGKGEDVLLAKTTPRSSRERDHAFLHTWVNVTQPTLRSESKWVWKDGRIGVVEVG